ncbi:hypothetical protein NOCARDAX2BIS_490077 [Nocardioides sp. AX2bis]|nr:hypothetical protein NOCARDAX2BIS_490077 [Nocardioides sp. AX2bis]
MSLSATGGLGPTDHAASESESVAIERLFDLLSGHPVPYSETTRW